MVHDVFISYAFEDKPIADAICAILETNQVRCWIAPRDIIPGEKFASAIINAIDRSELVILVFSSHADKSPHVKNEIEHAFSKEKILIPFRIENIEPSDEVQYFIGSRHWLDALTPPLEDHISKLTSVVRKNLDTKTETTNPNFEIISKNVIPEKGEDKNRQIVNFKRILAYCIDFGIGFAIGLGLFWVYTTVGYSILGGDTYRSIMFSSPGNNSAIGNAVVALSLMSGVLLYSVLTDIPERIRSVGKILFSLKIVRIEGKKKLVHWRATRSLLKNIPIISICIILIVLYPFIGKSSGPAVFYTCLILLLLWGLPILFTRKSQAIHDLIVGTIVRKFKG